VAWEIQGSAGYVFRAERIASLYHPGVHTVTERPLHRQGPGATPAP
jgi:hypothetical protein